MNAMMIVGLFLQGVAGRACIMIAGFSLFIIYDNGIALSTVALKGVRSVAWATY